MGATITGNGHALTLETVTTSRAAGAAERQASTRQQGGVRRLLRVPLFYKILVANGLILGAVVLLAGVTAHASTDGDIVALVALLGGGLLLSVVSNAVILRLALLPLQRLQQTVEQVQAGDLAARVEPSELADRELEQLMLTFNAILDSSDMYRRRLREIAARALNATEEERKRIARELHDGTAQTLAALRLRLRLARSPVDEEARVELLDRISADLGEATEEIRRIAQGLRPPALDMLGLAPAIESCARGIAENTGLLVDTALSPVEDMLTPEAELALYRIVQEALSNVARHSDADQVRIRLSRMNGTVVAVVEDDGRGFAVRDEMSSGGLGLFGMQERAAYVGGAVDIESQPGRGTRIQATIPVVETAPYA